MHDMWRYRDVTPDDTVDSALVQGIAWDVTPDDTVDSALVHGMA